MFESQWVRLFRFHLCYNVFSVCRLFEFIEVFKHLWLKRNSNRITIYIWKNIIRIVVTTNKVKLISTFHYSQLPYLEWGIALITSIIKSATYVLCTVADKFEKELSLPKGIAQSVKKSYRYIGISPESFLHQIRDNNVKQEMEICNTLVYIVYKKGKIYAVV